MSEAYGIPPGWRVDGYRVDENGAVTLEVVKPWTPLLVGEGDALTLPQIPKPPTIAGFRLTSGGWKRAEAGGMAITFEYQGFAPPEDGEENKRPEDEAGATWSLRGSLFQKDIRTISNWSKVSVDYEWKNDQKEFDDYLADTSKVVSPWVSTNDGKKKKLNPMRGVKSVDDFSATLTKTFLAKKVPPYIFQRINYVVGSAGPAGKIKDRDWKYMAPDFEQHGDFFRISEHLELSGPGGWQKDLYSNRAEAAG